MKIIFQLIFVLYFITKAVQGAIDFSRYDSTKNDHLEAALTLKNKLQGRPQQIATSWSLEKKQSIQPQEIQNMFNPNDPKSVQALREFQSALQGVPYAALSTGNGFSQDSQLATPDSWSPWAWAKWAGRWVARRFLDFLWYGLATVVTAIFPPAAALFAVNPVSMLLK